MSLPLMPMITFQSQVNFKHPMSQARVLLYVKLLPVDGFEPAAGHWI